MSCKHLSMKPKNINDDLWYYETNYGYDLWNRFGRVGVITSKTMRGYLKRKDKPVNRD